MTKQHYDTYRYNTLEARKTRQVVMIYDAVIRNIQQAKAAIEEGDIETRFNTLTKAGDLITGLQASLDFERGGEVAQTLYDYYAGVDMRIFSIHKSLDISMCDLCIKHLKMMREAWEEIDQKHDELEDSNSEHANSKQNAHEEGVAKENKEAGMYDSDAEEAIKSAANNLFVTA